jgi:hypothetical protein
MLNPNLYRYKGRIYSKLKEYSEEKVPLNIQAKEYQSTLFSKKQTGLKEGFSRDAKGRIRKTKDIINQAPTKREKTVLKDKITLVQTTERIKVKKRGKIKVVFKKTLEYKNSKGERVTKKDFDTYLKKLEKSGEPTEQRFLYNQSIINQALQFLAEGKKVVIKNGNKKTVLNKENLQQFITDTKKMLSQFYKNNKAEKGNYSYVVFNANVFGSNYAEIDISKTEKENADGSDLGDDESESDNFNFNQFYK